MIAFITSNLSEPSHFALAITQFIEIYEESFHNPASNLIKNSFLRAVLNVLESFQLNTPKSAVIIIIQLSYLFIINICYANNEFLKTKCKALKFITANELKKTHTKKTRREK